MRPDLHTLNPHLTNLEIPGHGREGLHEETSSRRSMPGVRVDLRWASTDASQGHHWNSSKSATGASSRKVWIQPLRTAYGSLTFNTWRGASDSTRPFYGCLTPC